MIELPDPCLRILRAPAAAKSAWLSPAEIAEAVGGGPEETTDQLASLDEAGWLVVWERPEGPVATLSALAASRLSLRLVEVGPDEVPRWARSGDPDPPAPRARHVCGAARGADLEFVVDPHELPETALERAELGALRDAGRGPRGSAARRWPTLVVGQGVSPWREVGPGPACPGCGGSPLRSDAYCLCCGRWGLDGPLVSAISSSPIRRPAETPARTAPLHLEVLQRAERLRRKVRRTTKLEARAAAEVEARRRKAPNQASTSGYVVFAPARGREVRAAGAGPS